MHVYHPCECNSEAMRVAVIQKVQQTICKNNDLIKSRTLLTESCAPLMLTAFSAVRVFHVADAVAWCYEAAGL